MKNFVYGSAALLLSTAAFAGGVVLMEVIFRTRHIPYPSELFGAACGAGFFCFTMAAFSFFKR